MKIEQLQIQNMISCRTYNICKRNSLDSVHDIIKYYLDKKTFIKLRNCGRKSNEELLEVVECYSDQYFTTIKNDIGDELTLKDVILKLSRLQREVINSFILENTKLLSNRSSNALLSYLDGNLSIKRFSEKIFSTNAFNIQKINNVGAKCVPEIEKYIKNINDFVVKVSKSDDEKYLFSLKNNFLIQRTFSITKIPDKILETESIFLLTHFLLNQNALFDETKTFIVQKTFKIYLNQNESTLDNTADLIKITRERVRQIRNNCASELFDKFLFVKNFKEDFYKAPT